MLNESEYLASRLRADVPALVVARGHAARGEWGAFDRAMLDYMRARREPMPFFDPAEVSGLMARISRVSPGEFAQTREIADHAMRWQFPGGSNAFIEQFVPLTPDYDFCGNPTADPQFVYAMNRLRWMPELAKMHRATGERKYLDFVLEFWRMYAARVGYPTRLDFDRRPKGWHGHLAVPHARLDCFIRLTNLWWTYWLLLTSQDLTPADHTWMLAQKLRLHDVVMMHGPSHLKQNHSAMQFESLFLTAALLPEFHGMEASAMSARIALEESFHEAFFDDGLHYEQSPDYGMGCLRWYGQSALLAQRNGHVWMRFFRDLLHKAFEAYDQITTPAGTCPLLGDSDPSQTAPFLTLGRALFPDLRFTCRLPMNANAVWYGVEEDRLPCAPIERVQHYENSGLAVVREGGNYLTFDCGTKGAWHGHDDLLSVHYWLNGRNLLADGGRWIYKDGDPLRDFLMSPSGHNTVAVAGRKMAAIEDPKHPALEPMRVAERDGLVWMSAAHRAFDLRESPARCARRLVHDPASGWLLVVDELSAEESLAWRQTWLFPREDVALRGAAVEVGGAQADGARLMLAGGEASIRAQVWSPRYAVQEPGRLVEVCATGRSVKLAMLLLPAGMAGALVFDPSDGAAEVTAGGLRRRFVALDWS